MQIVHRGRLREFAKTRIIQADRVFQCLVAAVIGVTAQHTLWEHDEIGTRFTCLFNPLQDPLKIGVNVGERDIGLDAGE